MKSFEMGNRIKLHKRCDIRYTVFISKTRREYTQYTKSEGGSMYVRMKGQLYVYMSNDCYPFVGFRGVSHPV